MARKTTAKAAQRKNAKAAVEKAVVEVMEVEAAKAAAEETVEAVEAAEEVKEEAKKAPAKKAAAKTTEKKEAEVSVVLQFSGQEVNMQNVVENAKKAFEAEGHRLSTIKELQVYVKPEEFAAYYVVNQKYTGKIDLF